MLVIDATLLNEVTEKLCILAREARDEQGLRVMVDLPRGPKRPINPENMAEILGYVGVDFKRARAITLAAILSLTGETCRISDEVHIGGFGMFEGKSDGHS